MTASCVGSSVGRFRKISANGASQVVFSHNHFQKDRIDLCDMMNGRVGDIQTKVVEVIQDSIAQPKHTETAAAANSALDRNMHAKNAAVIEIIPAQKSLQANIALVYAQVKRNEFVNQDICRGQLKAVTTHLLNQVPVWSLQDTSRFVMSQSYHQMANPHRTAMTNFQPEDSFSISSGRFSIGISVKVA